MVQMGAKTTTITEADLARQEMDLMKNFEKEEEKSQNEGPLSISKQEIIWSNVILITFIHILAVKCLYSYTGTIKLLTIIWGESQLYIIYKTIYIYIYELVK